MGDGDEYTEGKESGAQIADPSFGARHPKADSDERGASEQERYRGASFRHEREQRFGVCLHALSAAHALSQSRFFSVRPVPAS